MKKLLILLSIIVVGYIMPLNGLASNMIEYQVSYENAKITIDTVRGDNGQKYSFIEMENVRNSTSTPLPGNPCFPDPALLKFSVPFAATDFKLDVKVEEEEEIALPYPPFPAQPDRFAANNLSEGEGFIDLINFSDYSNPPVASLAGDYVAGLINRVLRIGINPVRWASNPKRIKVIRKMELKISWIYDDALLENVYKPETQSYLNRLINMTKAKVVNPEDVVKNCPYTFKNMQKVFNSSITPGDVIPYIIVTPKNLADNVERLAALRRLRGIETKVVCYEDILIDPVNANGDTISGINDYAGKVRNFLRNSQERNQTNHVLLASRFPEVTGRWVKSTPLAPKDTTLIEYISDQYFRDLTSPWPKAISGQHGDLSNLEGMYQDMNVGRVSFLSKSQIDAYIDKLIQYEFNVHNSDLSYLDNAFIMLGEDSSIAQQYNKNSKALYNKHFPSVTIDSIALKRLRTGAEVMDKMKNGNYGFIDLRGHGHYSGIEVYKVNDQKQYGISSVDSQKGIWVDEVGNGLDSYKNTNYPSWSLSMACSLSELGYNREGNSIFADSYILGHFTVR